MPVSASVAQFWTFLQPRLVDLMGHDLFECTNVLYLFVPFGSDIFGTFSGAVFYFL